MDFSEAYKPPQMYSKGPIPSQAESIVKGSPRTQLQEPDKPPSDIDYLAELIAIQANGPKDIGFFGTRNMGFSHQNLVEILSYAMVLTNNHIYTSGATGTNAAVIRGALRAEKPDLLTVVLPQSRSKQPADSQELLEQVQHVVEMPQNDGLTLLEASRICNRDIVNRVQQVICFAVRGCRLGTSILKWSWHLRCFQPAILIKAHKQLTFAVLPQFHDSKLLLETCGMAKDSFNKIVTLFFL
eukprot:jgi/Astpho2/2276/Aster-03247